MTAGSEAQSRRKDAMSTRNAEDLERLRIEQGQQFLRQMTDMFQQTRVDLASQFVPRSEMAHMNEAIERVARAVEQLTGNVRDFREQAPRNFADRAETKQDIDTLRADLEKIKAVYDADLRRGFDYRFDDMQRGYRGEANVERGWRSSAQQQGNQMLGWVIGGASLLFSIVINVVVVLATRH
jgi:archaellum component FlaC